MGEVLLCFGEELLCFGEELLCFEEELLCFEEELLCLGEVLLCFEEVLLCFEEVLLCCEEELLCLEYLHIKKATLEWLFLKQTFDLVFNDFFNDYLTISCFNNHQVDTRMKIIEG